jgi:hypothetical protein
MPVQEVSYLDQNMPDLAPPEFSPEEQEVLRLKMQTLDKLLATQRHAKYKLELFFGKARSLHKPTPGIISFWESGTKLHGGGDSKVYLCPGKLKKINECEAVIPEGASVNALHFCPRCGRSWKGSEVIGEYVANLTMKNWAHALLYYYQRLDHNADIYLKHAKDDIRTAAMLEQAKQKGGECLWRVRDKRALHIYPLANIIKDTSAGADLYGRFVSFLTA